MEILAMVLQEVNYGLWNHGSLFSTTLPYNMIVLTRSGPFKIMRQDGLGSVKEFGSPTLILILKCLVLHNNPTIKD
jgi:hypothetical protein